METLCVVKEIISGARHVTYQLLLNILYNKYLRVVDAAYNSERHEYHLRLNVLKINALLRN